MSVPLPSVTEYLWACHCSSVNGGRSSKINAGRWGWWPSRTHRLTYLTPCLSETGEGREDYDTVCSLWKLLVWCLTSSSELSCRKGFHGIDPRIVCRVGQSCLPVTVVLILYLPSSLLLVMQPIRLLERGCPGRWTWKFWSFPYKEIDYHSDLYISLLWV